MSLEPLLMSLILCMEQKPFFTLSSYLKGERTFHPSFVYITILIVPRICFISQHYLQFIAHFVHTPPDSVRVIWILNQNHDYKHSGNSEEINELSP